LLGFLLREGRLTNRREDSFAKSVEDQNLNLRGGVNVALRMTERNVSGVDVLDIEGRIVLGEESNAFREKVKSLLAAGKKKIVLNLAQVGYIDSAGLGTLVATFHSARSQGATLKLTNLGTKFKEVLQVTKLMTVFDTYDNEAAAIQSFGA
jgi:anti-sigma B factor antagonist